MARTLRDGRGVLLTSVVVLLDSGTSGSIAATSEVTRTFLVGPDDVGHMSSHAERVRALYRDVWNGADPSTVEDLVHEDYVIHDRELAEERSGPALYAQLAEETRDIFPDMAFEIEDLFTSGDRVAVRWTMTGTHRGPLFGVEGTGERVELSAIEINRFEGDLLIETWTQSDQLGMLGQIGALPE